MANQIPVDDAKVVKILANDPVFCNSWKSFCKVLQFDYSIVHDLEKMEPNCSVTDLVTKILEHWKSINFSQNVNLTTLSNKLVEIECLKSAEDVAKLGGIGSIKLKSNNIWFNIRSPRFYTGREIEMEKIQEQWKKCEEKKMMLFAAITGLGGIGKSELARNYAKQFYETEEGHCIGIDAETNQTLSQSFQHLAKNKLNLSLTDKSGKEKSLNTLAQEIYEKISDEKCLIIFDNMETYENSILTLLTDLASKQAPTILKPFVLTTSRLRPAIEFFGHNCIHLDLEVLSNDSALAFFCKSFSVDQDSVADIYEPIEKLCARLGNFPLAMQQAAAYIRRNISGRTNQSNLVMELTKYLKEIEEGTKKLLDHKLPQYESLDNVSKTTYLTWGITLDKIKNLPEIGNTAFKLMEIVSFLSPENISIELLSKILERAESSLEPPKITAIQNCLQSLIDHSMIDLSDDKTISVHRLVQEVVRIGLSEQRQPTNTLDQLLKAVMELIKKEEIPWDQMIHCEMIWKHAKENKELIEKHQNFPNWILWKFDKSGKYRELYEFSCQALSILESTVRQKNRSTLRIKYWKGTAHEYLGEYTECLPVLTEVYREQMEEFGEDDEDCLDTANGIGNVHLKLEKYKEAKKWYDNTLAKREKINGKKHEATLGLKINVARALDAQGKYKKAIEMYTEVLEVQQRVLNREHRNTLRTKQNLAVVRFHRKEYEDALSIIEEVLEVRERVLESDHPQTLNTKHWLAKMYKSLERKEEALQLATEVWEKRMEILGPEHPNTIDARKIIAGVLREQGKLKEAIEMYTEVLEVQQRVFGSEHRRTLTTKHKLAVVRFKQEDYEDALRMFEEVLKVRERLLELDHPKTLLTKYWIADTYLSLGSKEEAIQLHREVGEKRMEVLGPEHPDTMKSKNIIAGLLSEQGKFKEAIEMYMEVLEVQQRVLGTEDGNTLETKHNLAIVRFHQEEYEDALRIFKEVLEVRERLLELDHPKILLTKGWISGTYECVGRTEEVGNSISSGSMEEVDGNTRTTRTRTPTDN